MVQHVTVKGTANVFAGVISVEEQFLGWYTRVQRAKLATEIAWLYRNIVDVVEFAAMLGAVSYSELAIQRYELLRTTFRRLGKNDLRIAAIALEEGMKVITRNMSDFAQIPGLQIEDWSQ